MLSLPPPHPPILPILIPTAYPPTTPSSHIDSNAGRHYYHLTSHTQSQARPYSLLPCPDPLATLANDEALLHLRKQNIRRFGAGWLRPHGCTKTLQGIEDERNEREEAELLRQRELALEEARLAQEAMEMGDAGEGMEGEEMGHDLDEDVPDMDAEGEVEEEWSDSSGSLDEEGWDSEREVEEIEGLEGADGDFGSSPRPTPSNANAGPGRVFVTPGGSFQHPHPQVRRLPARTPVTPVVDLDDDVPEAGSYEHTDTELEDESTDGGSVAALPRVSGGGGRQQQGRHSSGGQRQQGNGQQLPQQQQTPTMGEGNSWLASSGGFAPGTGAGWGSVLGGSVFGSSPLAATQMGEGRVVSGASARRNVVNGRRVSGRRGWGREN